jgi:hypothetical protein
MSRIQDLIHRLEVIPEKEKKANHLGQMITIRDKLRESASNADTLRRAASALSGVEGAAFVDRASEALAAASTSAEKLKTRIAAGADFDRGKADGVLTHINEKLEGGTSAVTKGWRLLIDEKSRRYAPLAAAAMRASMPGAAGLQTAIVELEAWRDAPPQTAQAADEFNANASALPIAIANLGLEGPAGVFMVQASKGQAKAKDLLSQEVRDFLDANPAIWSMLTVGL